MFQRVGLKSVTGSNLMIELPAVSAFSPIPNFLTKHKM
jgi:hypothetical protein